jgi:hypothetical protein
VPGKQPGERPGKRKKGGRTNWLMPVLLFGVLMALGIGTGAGAMLWTADDAESANTAAAGTTQAAETTQPTDEPVVAGAAAPDPATACRDALVAADGVVTTARTGVEHWSGHVQARTDWLAGKISKDEQKRRFAETRAPGPQDVQVFKERDAAYQPQADACAALDSDPKYDACVARSNAARDAVEAGRKAIGDWEAHLNNMSAFRDGEFDPTHAQHLWLQSWETAPVNINAFRAADEALQHAPTCNV